MIYKMKGILRLLLDSRHSRIVQKTVFLLYILAGIWCLVSFVFLLRVFITAASSSRKVLDSPQTASLTQSLFPQNNTGSNRDTRRSTGGTRDPFQYGYEKGAIVAASPVGVETLVVRGVIFARNVGVVLENTATGVVAFLSEGETMGDVLVKKITKDAVTLIFNGQEQVVPIGRKP